MLYHRRGTPQFHEPAAACRRPTRGFGSDTCLVWPAIAEPVGRPRDGGLCAPSLAASVAVPNLYGICSDPAAQRVPPRFDSQSACVGLRITSLIHANA